MLKAAREKDQMMQKDRTIKMTPDLSMETLKPEESIYYTSSQNPQIAMQTNKINTTFNFSSWRK